MRKVFIDSNIFLRFLTQDDSRKASDCEKLLEAIEKGQLRPYISNIIILEIQFVLIKVYKFPKIKALKDLDTLLSLRNLTIIERTDTKKALELYKKNNIKYADCLIATQIPNGVKLVSYDEEFSRIGIKTYVPEQFV